MYALSPWSGGKITRHRALSSPMMIPLSPFPNMIAPIYLGGNIPEYAKVLACRRPAKIPKISKVVMQSANPVSGLLYRTMNGRIMMRMIEKMKPVLILIA